MSFRSKETFIVIYVTTEEEKFATELFASSRKVETKKK